MDTKDQLSFKNANSISLPDKPEEPAQSDCCGSGCTPCVFDIYEQELKIWERECRKRLQRDSENNSAKKLHPDEYTSFEIQSLKQDGDDCITFRFQLPGGTSLGLCVGQHIIMRGWSGTKSITRQYTPISPLDAIGYFDVVMRIYPSGKMSQIAKQWKIGDAVECRGPFGNFSYKRNKFKKLICLAAGTGIAPMIQVIRSILIDEEDDTLVRLLYSVKHYNQILMKPILDEWAGYWNFNCVYFLSQEKKEEDTIGYRYGDKINFGPIKKDIVLPELIDIEKTLVLICGTLPYDKDMLDFIREAGVPECNIHKF